MHNQRVGFESKAAKTSRPFGSFGICLFSTYFQSKVLFFNT